MHERPNLSEDPKGAVDVSLIIVNYRTTGLTKQCLKSIRDAGIGHHYEVCVVDNGSKDGAVELLRERFPEVQVIALKKNVGFARGNNHAIRASKGRYVFLLNPDAMLQPGALEKMVRYMDLNPKTAMVGPKLVRPDGSRQESVHRFPMPLTPVYRRTPLGRLPHAKRELDRYAMRDEAKDTPHEVDWMEGAALLVRREAIDDVGLFDERFFLYLEDTDWARRFWTKGWRVEHLPDVEVIHYHRRASADGNFLNVLTNPATRLHISSAIKYFWKWRKEKLPR